MARHGRGFPGGRAGGARHAAALLAAARRAGHRGVRLAVADRAGAEERAVARLGLGHRPFRRRLLLDRRSLLRAARRLRLARRADRGGPRGVSRSLPGPCGRAHTPAGRALAGAGRALSPPGPAGDRLDRGRMAARPPVHRICVESARPCLGLRRALAAKRRPVRRLWPGHAHLPRPGGADRRLAGRDRRARGIGRRGLRRPEHDGSGRPTTDRGCASCSPMSRKPRSGGPRTARGNSPSWSK